MINHLHWKLPPPFFEINPPGKQIPWTCKFNSSRHCHLEKTRLIVHSNFSPSWAKQYFPFKNTTHQQLLLCKILTFCGGHLLFLPTHWTFFLLHWTEPLFPMTNLFCVVWMRPASSLYVHALQPDWPIRTHHPFLWRKWLVPGWVHDLSPANNILFLKMWNLSLVNKYQRNHNWILR
jgi:hypothetical protein